MKYELILDENNYLIGFSHSETDKDIYEINTSEINIDYINCYKLVDDKIIFDEEKYNRLINKNLKDNEMATLKHELSTYDYIGIKISMGVATKEEYADKIAYTETLRERIRVLESELEK